MPVVINQFEAVADTARSDGETTQAESAATHRDEMSLEHLTRELAALAERARRIWAH
jgi:hypothetical protein